MNSRKAMPAGRQGFSLIWVAVIALVVVAVAAAVYYFVLRQPGSVPIYSLPTTQPLPNQVDNTQAPIPTVNRPQDLTTVSSDLDNTNIDSLNTQLNQNTSDTTGF